MGVSNRLGGSNLCHSCDDYTNHLLELTGSLRALNMAILTKITYLCSLRGKIDFENLLVIEKKCQKTYH